MTFEIVETEDGARIRHGPSEAFFAELVAIAHATPPPTLSAPAMRDVALAFARSALAHPLPPHVECEEVEIPCGVRARWYWPRGADRAPMLYLHGGGYVCGSIEASHGLAGQIAAAFNAPLLAVGYRQAPEHPIPAALADTHTAHAWLNTQTDEPVILIGDSAGGQLAAAASAMAGKAGLRTPRAAIAISPWFDLAMARASWTQNKARDLSTVELGAFFRKAYLGGAPVTAAGIPDCDLVHLPPTMIVMGGGELALDDASSFVARAHSAGARVRLEIYEDLPHNFVRYASEASSFALERIAAWAAEL